jgi:hypothetical protein
MKIFFLYSLVIALSLIHQNPACGQADHTVKTTVQEQAHSPATDAVVLDFTGTINNDRIILNWSIDKNQVVDKIEVERSTDEKNFIMAGLVFGTDQADKVEYIFYEKNKKVKSFYRLKIINKDFAISYSSIITPEPATAKR